MNRRQSARKALDPIHVTEITVGECTLPLASAGTILNASATGLLIRVRHSALSPTMVQPNGTLAPRAGTLVMMHIVEMALDIDGEFVRAQQIGSKGWDIAVDFADSAPAYWRECLVDLLPNVGEMTSGAGAA